MIPDKETLLLYASIMEKPRRVGKYEWETIEAGTIAKVAAMCMRIVANQEKPK